MRPLIQFVIGLGMVLIVWYGGILAVRGEMTEGQFVEFTLFLMRLIWPLIALGYVVNLYQRGTASLKRMNAIFAVEPAVKDAAEVRERPPVRGRIEFRNLTYAYTGHSPAVLKNINVTIEAGQTAA